MVSAVIEAYKRKFNMAYGIPTAFILAKMPVQINACSLPEVFSVRKIFSHIEKVCSVANQERIFLRTAAAVKHCYIHEAFIICSVIPVVLTHVWVKTALLKIEFYCFFYRSVKYIENNILISFYYPIDNNDRFIFICRTVKVDTGTIVILAIAHGYITFNRYASAITGIYTRIRTTSRGNTAPYDNFSAVICPHTCPLILEIGTV